MKTWLLFIAIVCQTTDLTMGQDWRQFQSDALRSGNASTIKLPDRLELVGYAPTTDGIYSSPVVAGGVVYVLDGSGVLHAWDANTLAVKWRFESPGGKGNCNNVSTPAIVGKYIHFGTMAGYYFVLDRESGKEVKKIDCKEAIFSSPVADGQRVYFATLGAQIYAVEFDGNVAWKWDFVREVIGFQGDRWKGEDWLKERPNRVTWRDHFVCSRELCLIGKTLVVPAGGRTLFLDDMGSSAKLRIAGEIPAFDGNEYPATFGQSADAAGNVYVQWHRRDNAGRVEVLKLEGDKIETRFIGGTQTAIQLPGLLSFASVSVLGNDAYRVRPEVGFGLCRHALDKDDTQVLCAAPSICPPVITSNHVIYGGLDSKLYVVPRNKIGSGVSEPIALPTAFGASITAPVAVADGKIYAACEDGYLYVYGGAPGPNGTTSLAQSTLPTIHLRVDSIRSPLTGPLASSQFDWYTNYGDYGSTNSNNQGLQAPLRMRWARRLEGTIKHLPVCGGGRLYTHTAEGQIIACEQDTGRLLWRRHWPDVYLSFTSPLYTHGKLIVPQAGIKHSSMRCLDASNGKLLWEAPFTGSPSWSRQFPPVVHGNLAIYASGSGQYANQGTEKPFTFKGTPEQSADGSEVMSWIYSNDNPYYPRDNRPMLWAWDIETGKLVWQKDFSELGRGGNDCGICMMDGKLFYSTFFGYSASLRARRGLPPENNGLTACLDPTNGEVIWKTTDYYVTAKCTLSARDGRIFIGGNNRPNESTQDRFVWCLDAKDGSLVWKSDPITSALNVVSVGKQFIFSNALRGRGNVFDKLSGKVVGGVDHNYACCRFTLSEPFILGANMDMIDLSQDSKLVSTGPAIDSRECLGAVVSNGRIFYTSQASGFIVSQTYGADTEKYPAVWNR
ncbi:MAG: PQQ-binding-like beta-propeller repeat protein [Pirellula sp.]